MLKEEKRDKLDELLYLSRGSGEMRDVLTFDSGETAVVWSRDFTRRRAAVVRHAARRERAERAPRRTGAHRVRPGLLIAAVLVLVMTLTFTVAAVDQDRPLWQELFSLFDLNVEEDASEGQVELVVGEVVRRYDTVEEALLQGGYDVMYPTVLPGDARVMQVLHIHHGDEADYELLFAFDDERLRYSVYSDPAAVPEDMPGRLTYVVADRVTCIILPVSDAEGERYQACFQDGKYGYILTYHDLEELLAILEDIKEVER